MDRLENALVEHALAGEKLVCLVRITDAERGPLLNWIRGKRRPAGDLTSPFPSATSTALIRANHLSDPASLGNEELEDGAAAFFTAVRSFMDRVEVPLTDLKASANDGYEQIFAVKRVYRQTFDAIWLPAGKNFAVLAADLPPGVPSGFASYSQTYLASQLRKALGRPVVLENLWPAIHGLFKSEEGRLVDHGFVNNEHAVKNHTARRGGRSLRDDEYDKAGAEKVGDDLLTYKTAVAWDIGEGDAERSQPEVLLPGTSRSLKNNKLEHFIARNCINSRDLAFVISKIAAYL